MPVFNTLFWDTTTPHLENVVCEAKNEKEAIKKAKNEMRKRHQHLLGFEIISCSTIVY